jgi:hypothetical protein
VVAAAQEREEPEQVEQEDDHRAGFSPDQSRRINHLAADGVLANDRSRTVIIEQDHLRIRADRSTTSRRNDIGEGQGRSDGSASHRARTLHLTAAWAFGGSGTSTGTCISCNTEIREMLLS